jgi:hypothetical protein
MLSQPGSKYFSLRDFHVAKHYRIRVERITLIFQKAGQHDFGIPSTAGQELGNNHVHVNINCMRPS